ncbi:MAG: ribonuclease H-like domain-containing protein [Bacteroidia bacterium]|nr:ribonuclease H-like domain-containing protein [Bacteroidia bacterium]MDW8135042.1 ribonuclease H-like domain-containing protein [Bacteroidia bacterium]
MRRFPPIDRVIFIDIEVAPIYASLSQVPPELRSYWENKYNPEKLKTNSSLTTEEYFSEKSGIHALYSRVVCIGIGYFCIVDGRGYQWEEEIIYDIDEAKLLRSFTERWEKFHTFYQEKSRIVLPPDAPTYAVCGHNIANFDIPFLGRRLLISKIPLPSFWQEAQNAQLWQLKNPAVIDTMLLWNFTSRENSHIPLEILALALEIPFRKSLTHEQIREAFYQWMKSKDQNDIHPVLDYCLTDVRTTAKVYMHFQLDKQKREEMLQKIK